MGRKILAVICSYAALSLFILITFTLIFNIIGVEASYKPGTYDTSTLWNVISLVIGAMAAFLGGWLCVRISRDFPTVYGLIALIAVFGVLEVFRIQGMAASTEIRPADVSLQDTISRSIMPLWVAAVNPIIGIVFGLMGGRVGAPGDSRAQTAPPSPR